MKIKCDCFSNSEKNNLISLGDKRNGVHNLSDEATKKKKSSSLPVPIPGWIYSAFSSDSAAQEEVVLLTLQEILPVLLPASSMTPDWFHFWFNQCPSLYKKWQEDSEEVCEDGTEPPGI